MSTLADEHRRQGRRGEGHERTVPFGRDVPVLAAASPASASARERSRRCVGAVGAARQLSASAGSSTRRTEALARLRARRARARPRVFMQSPPWHGDVGWNPIRPIFHERSGSQLRTRRTHGESQGKTQEELSNQQDIVTHMLDPRNTKGDTQSKVNNRRYKR